MLQVKYSIKLSNTIQLNECRHSSFSGILGLVLDQASNFGLWSSAVSSSSRGIPPSSNRSEQTSISHDCHVYSGPTHSFRNIFFFCFSRLRFLLTNSFAQQNIFFQSILVVFQKTRCWPVMNKATHSACWWGQNNIFFCLPILDQSIDR